jgi:hypothetical protein
MSHYLITYHVGLYCNFILSGIPSERRGWALSGASGELGWLGKRQGPQPLVLVGCTRAKAPLLLGPSSSRSLDGSITASLGFSKAGPWSLGAGDGCGVGPREPFSSTGFSVSRIYPPDYGAACGGYYAKSREPLPSTASFIGQAMADATSAWLLDRRVEAAVGCYYALPREHFLGAALSARRLGVNSLFSAPLSSLLEHSCLLRGLGPLSPIRTR